MFQLILHLFMVYTLLRAHKLFMGSWAGWHPYLFIWLALFFFWIDCCARNFWVCIYFDNIYIKRGLYLINYTIGIIFFLLLSVIVAKFFFYPIEYWWCYLYNYWNWLINLLYYKYRYRYVSRHIKYYLIWYYQQLCNNIFQWYDYIWLMLGLILGFIYIINCVYRMVKWHNNMYFLQWSINLGECTVSTINIVFFFMCITILHYFTLFYTILYISNNRLMGGIIYYFYYFYYFAKIARWSYMRRRNSSEYSAYKIISNNMLIISASCYQIYYNNGDSYIYFYNYLSWIIYLRKLFFFKTWKYALLLTSRSTELNTLYLFHGCNQLGYLFIYYKYMLVYKINCFEYTYLTFIYLNMLNINYYKNWVSLINYIVGRRNHLVFFKLDQVSNSYFCSLLGVLGITKIFYFSLNLIYFIEFLVCYFKYYNFKNFLFLISGNNINIFYLFRYIFFFFWKHISNLLYLINISISYTALSIFSRFKKFPRRRRYLQRLL